MARFYLARCCTNLSISAIASSQFWASVFPEFLRLSGFEQRSSQRYATPSLRNSWNVGQCRMALELS